MFQTHRDSEELTALYEILTGTADATGEKFFDALVGHMSKATTVRLTTHGRAATDCSSISYDCFSLAAI